MKALNLTSSRQDILKTNADAKAMRLFVLLVFLLLSCSGVFGQTAEPANAMASSATENVTDKAEKTEASSSSGQLELVKWFMGAKQVSPAGQPARASQKSETAKRILINCGMTPNRILSRTLLKKAMQYENNIA